MSKMSASGAAFSGLLVEIFQLNGMAIAAGDRLSAPLGLTSARWHVMAAVDDGPATVAQVARTMKRTRQSVRETVEVLVREGFLAYEENPGHLRAKLLTLTEQGQRAVADVEQRHVAWANRMGRALDADALQDAVAKLQEVRALLERELTTPPSRTGPSMLPPAPPSRKK